MLEIGYKKRIWDMYLSPTFNHRKRKSLDNPMLNYNYIFNYAITFGNSVDETLFYRFKRVIKYNDTTRNRHKMEDKLQSYEIK
jgi:hypothetical protein